MEQLELPPGDGTASYYLAKAAEADKHAAIAKDTEMKLDFAEMARQWRALAKHRNGRE